MRRVIPIFRATISVATMAHEFVQPYVNLRCKHRFVHTGLCLWAMPWGGHASDGECVWQKMGRYCHVLSTPVQ